jgi:hypothetical protein
MGPSISIAAARICAAVSASCEGVAAGAPLAGCVMRARNWRTSYHERDDWLHPGCEGGGTGATCGLRLQTSSHSRCALLACSCSVRCRSSNSSCAAGQQGPQYRSTNGGSEWRTARAIVPWQPHRSHRAAGSRGSLSSTEIETSDRTLKRPGVTCFRLAPDYHEMRARTKH